MPQMLLARGGEFLFSVILSATRGIANFQVLLRQSKTMRGRSAKEADRRPTHHNETESRGRPYAEVSEQLTLRGDK